MFSITRPPLVFTTSPMRVPQKSTLPCPRHSGRAPMTAGVPVTNAPRTILDMRKSGALPLAQLQQASEQALRSGKVAKHEDFRRQGSGSSLDRAPPGAKPVTNVPRNVWIRGGAPERSRRTVETNRAEEGTDLRRLRRQVAFDRLLARLFVEPLTEWVLTGGYAMELRFRTARATQGLTLLSGQSYQTPATCC